MKSPIVYETLNDLTAKHRAKLILLLNQRLASAVDLQTQVKQAHWNVKGPNFIALHNLFDLVAESVENHADSLAERISQLGGIALGTARVASRDSCLAEYPLEIGAGRSHVQSVAHALATWGEDVRKAVSEANDLEDFGSADLLTEILRGVEKWLWFVEAHGQTAK